jgi:hypothetical protein
VSSVSCGAELDEDGPRPGIGGRGRQGTQVRAPSAG